MSNKVIVLSGSDFEIGRQHGEQCKDKIKVSLESYRAMFEELVGLSWNDVLAFVDKDYARLEALDQSAFEEMAGIAEGAGVSIKDIVALNIRSELLFAITSEPQLSDGCTSFASLPNANAANETMIGQNWDWIDAQRGACFIAQVYPENGPNYCMVTEAGIIGKIGYNSEGIGVCFNALSCGFNPEGWPLHFYLRKILRSSNIIEAMNCLVLNPSMCAGNFMLGSAEGVAYNVEVTPSNVDVITDENNCGVIVHSNHLIGERNRLMADTTIKLMGATTYHRLNRCKKLMLANKPTTYAEFFEVLADGTGGCEGICQRPNNGKEGIMGSVATVFSIVMNLSKGEASISLTTPTPEEAVIVTLPETPQR